VVKAACSKNMARTMRLRQLYRQFRSLSKDTIEYVLFKNRLVEAGIKKLGNFNDSNGNIFNRTS
jgi:hypothetical protein